MNDSTNVNSIRQARITVNVTVTTAWNAKVKGQGHTTPKIDFEAWRRHHARPLRVVQLL